MSYAIESKKRKFERILESLTDASAPAAKTASKPQTNVPVTSATQSKVVDASKRRRVTPTIINRLSNASATSLSTHYLPSSRGAFLERLETFRNITRWHIPSTSSINAAEWAKRGWLCQDTDTVACPSCKERIFVDLETEDRPAFAEDETDDTSVGNSQDKPEDDDDPLVIANAVYESLIKRYTEMIVTAHKDGCPWRRRGCDTSIQRIEGLLNTASAVSTLKTRYDTILSRGEELPSVASLPSTPSLSVMDGELSSFEVDEQSPANTDALKLALCGWQGKESEVVECRNCFRSLGMWLYRGSDPTMQQLDPIDSHLDYCPWRSTEAQDTEIVVGKDHTKEKVCGWMLVYMAVAKDNAKRGARTGGVSRPMTGASEAPTDTSESNMTSDQREKKMKDLLRRIKELKKPFNVKNLLRKKDKVQV